MYKNIILSAYSCDPSKGSEPGNGFNWADQLAKYGHRVYCITTNKGQEHITKAAQTHANLEFVYINLPFGLDKMYFWTKLGMYAHYLIWQWLAFKHAKKKHRTKNFDLVHHVTWGSLQLGSFMYKLPIPFVFGPAGGGQQAPEAFKDYFQEHWETERKREKVSEWLQNINPACKTMIKKAKVILATNIDTYNMANKLQAKDVAHIFDAALPSSFFINAQIPKKNKQTTLKLLWVGRFLPRKGILLVLDVMKALKNHPDITLTVVGDGEMKNAFLNKIKEYNLDVQVKWVGKVPFEQVKIYYANHDVFFFTSLRDSSPAQLIEAMAYGLPVVTLNLHGQSLMVSTERGCLSSVESKEKTIQELTDYILKLNNDREKLYNLSLNAFKFASEQTWPNKVKYVTEKFYN